MNISERLLLPAEDFKRQLLSSPGFSDEQLAEISQSDFCFKNVYFGIVPEGMSIPLFLDIMARCLSLSEKMCARPLFPPVQRTWDGARVADWLINEEVVDISKRLEVASKLTGDLFLQGRVLGVLEKESVKTLRDRLRTKVSYISDYIWNYARAANNLVAVVCGFFGIDLGNIRSMADLKGILLEKYELKIPELRTFKPAGTEDTLEGDVNMDWKLAFEQVYLFKDEVAKSFVKHILYITNSNPDHYFAAYTFLGQSSGMGKSRLLSESWEYEDHALFIIYINCRKRGDHKGYPFTGSETDDLVSYIMTLRSQGQMARLLRVLLQTIFKKALDANGFLLDAENRSKSIEGLKIEFKDIQAQLEHPDQELTGEGALVNISEMIEGMKLKCPKTGLEKTVIPVIAFDEAARLIDNKFQVVNVAISASSGGEEINTFRLIRRVLYTDKSRLWKVPFVFAGTNTKFVNFVPPLEKYPSHGEGFGVNDAVKTAVTLFEPFILTFPFNFFAYSKNYGLEDIADWNQYIESQVYTEHLCNLGRPLWGALVRTAEKKYTNETKFNKVISGSKLKIFYNPEDKCKDDRLSSALSIMGILAAADYSTEKCAASLVEKGMAFLFHYDRISEKLFISYPPEPVLAITALKQLQSHPEGILSELMQVESGVFSRSIGDMGEFVAKILFLLSIPNPDLLVPYYPIKDFLKNLIGLVNWDKLRKSRCGKQLLGARVCFSYFSTFEHIGGKPDPNIGSLVLLNAAISLGKCFKGLDMHIPLVLKDGKLSSINVQVKSHRQNLTGVGDIRTRLYSSMFTKKGIPELRIIMNISPFVENKFEIHETKTKTNQVATILMEGWEPCLKATLARYPDSLGTILHTLLSTGRPELNSVNAEQFLPFKSNIENISRFLSSSKQSSSVFVPMILPEDPAKSPPKQPKKRARRSRVWQVESIN